MASGCGGTDDEHTVNEAPPEVHETINEPAPHDEEEEHNEAEVNEPAPEE